jgi:CHAT domain-containing protein
MALMLVTLALIIILLFLPACSRHRDPQATLDHARKTLRDGNMATAAEEAEQGYKEFHNVSAEWAWKFTLLRANALHAQSMDDEMLKLLAAEATPGPSGELAVKKARLEGQAYTSLHRFKDAERTFAEAERLCAVTEYPACADVSSARGVMEMNRARYAEAQRFFARVLPAAHASGDQFWVASSMLDLSWAAEEQAHFDEALDWSGVARSISVDHGFPDLEQAASGNMGWAYYKLGDLEKAERMFIDATKQAAKVGDTTDQLKWMLDLGYVYSDNGDLSAAEQSYRQSLDLAQKLKSREDIINAIQALAFVSERTSKLDDAKRYADEALSMARADGNKRDETYPRLVQGRVAAHEHDLATAEAAFHEVEQSSDSPVFLKWEAEHSLARLYEDENQTDAAAHEYCTALSTFESARSELQHEDSRLPFLTNASGIYDDYIHFLVSKGKTAEALQAAEYQRGRTLAEGLGLLKTDSSKTGTSKKDSLQKEIACKPGKLNPQAIARRAGGAILFYSLGEKQSYLWTITTQKTNLFVLPAKSEIDPTIQRYRKDLAEQQEFLPRAGADGRTLYRMLVAPAQSMLAKEGKVFVIPDGSLNTLNFETLLVGDAGDPASHYWIDDATIADASSLHMLAAASTSSKRNNNLLLLGNAVAPSADYPELRQASAEMESIEKHFAEDRQQVFNREQATPTAYLASKPDQFSYIHFVAHGTASRVSPLDSAIVLSSASKQDDSFKLYARDIIHQPLHARLVTISTCYGAGARAYSGEGLVGLSWAFLRAGAHNVIGALWEVSDNSTPQLMDTLYDGLQKGQNPDAALRAAKLSLLHSKNAFNKPFYWAPFQLYTRS